MKNGIIFKNFNYGYSLMEKALVYETSFIRVQLPLPILCSHSLMDRTQGFYPYDEGSIPSESI